MQEGNTLLDEIEKEIKRHCVFDKEEKYVAHALWIIASHFLKHRSLRVFDAFPMLGFMSPQPASGKSQALKITQLLSCNAIAAGSHTTASLLAKIDAEPDKIITLCLDEIDTVFSHGKDTSDLVRLFNLGYERDAFISRCKRFGDGTIETPAYCPKVFAGLSMAKIPAPTKTRSIIVAMRPKQEHEKVERHTDFEALASLQKRLEDLSDDGAFLAKLKAVEFDAGFLNNRDQQIWEPLLAVASATSSDWYRRALKSALFFTDNKPEKNLSGKILSATYRVFRSGKFLDKIHSRVLLEELHELGIPKWVDQAFLSECFASYDPEISTRQMKIGSINLNGYDWHRFHSTFRTYITDKEVAEIEAELGIVGKEEAVGALEPLW